MKPGKENKKLYELQIRLVASDSEAPMELGETLYNCFCQSEDLGSIIINILEAAEVITKLKMPSPGSLNEYRRGIAGAELRHQAIQPYFSNKNKENPRDDK